MMRCPVTTALSAPPALLALVHFFIELCLLRRNPQDLPASGALFGVVLAAAVLGGLLLSVTAGASLAAGFTQTLLDLLLMLGVLHLALKALNKQTRYLQTATSLVGADVVIGLVALLPVSLAAPAAGAEPGPDALIAGLLFLALVGWSVLVVGHILRHAFDLSLAQGVVIAIAFDVFSFVVISAVTQGPA
ncbi:hypothetical protein [Thiohalocapsa sp.]|jgi:hypothetical protein|uniref:hypothetical protein n=1 Tax=Thiohalocapsa sp. TaxID=2497641 RepID=UPI0025E2D148|nr:hypothetical protein [Thiohalocapsa sp.]